MSAMDIDDGITTAFQVSTRRWHKYISDLRALQPAPPIVLPPSLVKEMEEIQELLSLYKPSPEPVIPTTFHYWNLLPTELQRQIISYAVAEVVGPASIDSFRHQQLLRGDFGSLLVSGDHKFAELVRKEYYLNNTFQLWVRPGAPTAGYCRPNAESAGLIQSLEVITQECIVGETLEDMLCFYSSHWRCLLWPKRRMIRTEMINDPEFFAPASSLDLAWQLEYHNLRHLTVKIRMNRAYKFWRNITHPAVLFEDDIDNMIGWLEDTETDLKANNVVVLVEGYRRMREQCEEDLPVIEYLTRMFTKGGNGGPASTE